MQLTDSIISKNRFLQNLKTLWKHKFLVPSVSKIYLEKILFGKNRIRLVEIAVGYECNARCEQCSCALSLDQKRERLALSEFKNLIEDSIKLGAFQFNLTGGEPLLYLEDTRELIKYLKGRKCYTHLCSNGILIDEERLKDLGKLGLNSLEFGLDSANEKIHDQNRGHKGAYQNVMMITKLAPKLGLTIIWDTIITHEKIRNGDMESLVDLSGKMGAYLQITPPCVMGRWADKEEILLDQKEREYFKNLLRSPWVRTDTYSGLFKIGCSAAREKFAVNPYGDVLPCSLIQIPYGNIRERPLDKIWEEMLKNPFYHGKGGVLTCLPSFNQEFIEKHLQ